ncbi:hypothetical protein SUGI_0952370 [Cryptomeria japonica]|uniref:rRNA (cytosine-C(5))-methyltransferase NOP2C n=1 Tax=Cryptomeria japonica TaxID=3369 RepID=UPI00241499EE|nr:rRNA (cytosine-C(5))-methyltransferase NOP2C [Cryptomeria japonica]GLJ45248.1 hypothetical protein SUGI_0952370 [Cryptomeria japonica]
MMEESLPAALALPAAFVEFLKGNGIDPRIYAATAAQSFPRYVRVKPGVDSDISKIENDFEFKFEPVLWLPGFFSIPPQAQVASSEAYRHGKIYGMDAASGAAVLALNVNPGEHVLDLCAAPGAKLCMLADLLKMSGTLTGVDIAKHRLAACRTMLQKYELGDHCRLFVADGTSFNLLPIRKPVELECNNDHEINGKSGLPQDKLNDTYGEWTSKRTWKERRNSRRAPQFIDLKSSLEPKEPEMIFYGKESGIVGLKKSSVFQNGNGQDISEAGYDKVLVDAECTHEGSIKHVCKFEQWGWDTLKRRLLDIKRINSISHLQLQLLNNGFRLLKVSGILVYSTCSLTTTQNEGVVEQFLAVNPNARLQEIEIAKDWPCKSGSIEYTLRFDPLFSKTSGLFIAKIVKVASLETYVF